VRERERGKGRMETLQQIEAAVSLLSGHVADSLGKTKQSCAVVLDPALHSMLLGAALAVDPGSAQGGASPVTALFAKAGATREFLISKQEFEWKDDGPVVFILRPSPATCKLVAAQMSALIRSRAKPDFRAVFVPRRSFRCEQVLKDTGVLNWFNHGIHAVSMGFIPVEDDVLSMEMDEFLRETKVEGDGSAYCFAARALLDLGEVKTIRYKGVGAEQVANMYVRMVRELSESVAATPGGDGDRSFAIKDDFVVDDHDGGMDAEDKAWSATIKPGGPLDVFGGPPRPSSRSRGKRQVQVDTLIMFDREVDMVSPLCTAVTYEALLDEHFGGIRAGSLTVKASVLRIDESSAEDAEQGPGGNAPVTLSFKSDPLFREIRDASFTSIMTILNERARQLKDEQDRMHRTRDIEDLQGFIQRLPELQQMKKRLTTHIALGRRVQALTADRKFRSLWQAERAAIKDDATILEQRSRDSAARGEPLVKVLRQLCLACILGGGYTQRDLDAIRQEIVHAYGYDTIFALDSLERLGMLAERPFHPQHKLSSATAGLASITGTAFTAPKNDVCIFSNFGLVRDKMKLLVDTDDPKDSAYVFMGYRPITARLVELELVEGGWAAHQDVMRSLGPGAPVGSVNVQNLASSSTSSSSLLPGGKASTGVSDNGTGASRKKTAVVFFLGGVTLAEIAALRAIASRPTCAYRILIATTSVVNGTSLILSLSHPDRFSYSQGSASRASNAASSDTNPFS